MSKFYFQISTLTRTHKEVISIDDNNLCFIYHLQNGIVESSHLSSHFGCERCGIVREIKSREMTTKTLHELKL